MFIEFYQNDVFLYLLFVLFWVGSFSVFLPLYCMICPSPKGEEIASF